MGGEAGAPLGMGGEGRGILGGNGEREREDVCDGWVDLFYKSISRKEGWRVKRCGFDCMIPRLGATFYSMRARQQCYA